MIKRRTKTIGIFSMSSMTDIIFLLLIFFMLTSTIVVPNGIKVDLPQGKAKADKLPMASITIKKDQDITSFYFKNGTEESEIIKESQIEEILDIYFEDDTEKSVALYVDEGVLFSEAVKVLDIAKRKKYKMVLATRPPKK